MGNFSIKSKLLGIVLVAVVVSTVVLAVQSIITINQVSDANIEKYKKEAYSIKEKELENYVSVALNTVDTFYQRSSKEKFKIEVQQVLVNHTSQIFNIIQKVYDKEKGKIPTNELKDKIKFIISSSTYGKSGYFWINDMDSVIIDHPIKPALNGKDLSKFKDKNGKAIFVEFVNVCKKDGSGYVDYVWPKPGFEKPQPKVSYLKVFKPFKWIIGTGAYVDDVSNKMQKEALKAISKMKYGKSGYFWINNTEPKMLMHPIKPALDGKDLSKVKDPNGVYLFNEMVKVSNTSVSGGLVKYSWAKPGKDKPQLKFSYVKKFQAWNWIIGTGAYVDDIEDKVRAMQKETSEKIQSTIINFIISTLVIIVLVNIIINMIITKAISKPLENFQDGLQSFFDYLNRQSTTIEHLDDSSSDEIGKMAKVVNENISRVKLSIDEDDTLINQAKTTMSRVKNGWYGETITLHTSNPTLESFKNVVNDMILATREHLLNINTRLEEYSKSDYRNDLKLNNIEEGGVFETLVNDINILKDSITKILTENKQAGLTLDESSDILLDNVDILNKNANLAATSLEETSVALSEVTEQISNNSDDVIKMATYGNDVKSSVSQGQILANQTTTAMDEINNEVTSISEAITVIDQIAFQTNILSLNAAVEAATAGEAGKGFAVVAQEVRNLASRSAEAANEIKALVEKATSKANNGKKIADEMINGYTHLNESISKTLSLISKVEDSSKGQQKGIVQINDAINALDKQTQENANIASQTYTEAIQTDTIAKQIVKSADDKQFNGRENIKIKKIENNINIPTPTTIAVVQ